MASYTKRDKEVAKAIHKLFRRAWAQDKPNFVIWWFTRPPALFIYNILIPFQVAYCLQAIVKKDFDAVPGYAYSVLALAFLYAILWAIGGVAIIKNARAGAVFVQKEVFMNYISKDYEFLSNTFLGTLGSQAIRLRESLDEYDQILFNGFCKQIIIVVSSVAIIGYQSPILALITIVSMVLILSFTVLITRWRIKYRRLLSEANSETSGVISDALGHGATVKSFAAEHYEEMRLGRVLSKLADTQYRAWMTSIPADVGRMVLSAVATFLLLIMTARLYQEGAISIAIVILVQLYVIKLIMATQDIADLIKAYEATMSAAHQAVKTMLIESTVLDPKNPKQLPKKKPLTLKFEGVTYRYKDAKNGTEAVKNFNLKIRQGEKIGVVGYSGSGKTTLTKLLLRFVDVTEGSISIAGVDIRAIRQRELRSKLSYVPQEPLLFHRSVAENVEYGKPGAPKKHVFSAGKAAYMDEFVNELKNGYGTQVGEKGVKLSGGQRQRVAIARALLKDAPILVLDEATSALDSESEKYVQKALWRLMKGRTAIVVAHRLSTIQLMDRIIVMDKGTIVQSGTHSDLLKDAKGIYSKLWKHQSGGYINTSDELA